MSHLPSGEVCALGNELFKRSASGVLKAMFYLSLAGIVFSLLGCVALLAAFGNHPQILFLLFMPAGLFATCLLSALALMAPCSTVLSVCQHGVRRSNWFGSKELRYDQLDSFALQVVDQYVYGVYRGTVYSLQFQGTHEGRRQKLNVDFGGQRHDPMLEDLRNAISLAMSRRLAAQMQQQGSVPWTPQMTLTPAGVGLRRGGLIPLAEIADYRIEEGYFELFARGQSDCLIREPVGVANFFPGLIVFESLVRSRSPATQAAEATGGSAPAAASPAQQPVAPDSVAGSPVDLAHDGFAGCRAIGLLMVSLLGSAALFVSLGGAAFIFWKFLEGEEPGILALTVAFFPALGTLLSFIAALVVHRRERRRVALWRESPRTVESMYGRPHPAAWTAWKLLLPLGLLLLVAAIPETLVLMFGI